MHVIRLEDLGDEAAQRRLESFLGGGDGSGGSLSFTISLNPVSEYASARKKQEPSPVT